MGLFSNFPQGTDSEIKGKIKTLEERVQPVEKGGTGATTAAQALENLGAARAEFKSYVGTGTSGADNPCSITFSSQIKIAIFIGIINSAGTFFSNEFYSSSQANKMMASDLLTTNYKQAVGFHASAQLSCFGKKSSDGKTLYWYNSNADRPDYQQLNEAGITYLFVGI